MPRATITRVIGTIGQTLARRRPTSQPPPGAGQTVEPGPATRPSRPGPPDGRSGSVDEGEGPLEHLVLALAQPG